MTAAEAMGIFLQETARQFAAEEGRYPNGAEIYVLGLFAEWLDGRYRLKDIHTEQDTYTVKVEIVGKIEIA